MVDVLVFQVFGSIVKVGPAHLHYVRIFAGSNGCLQVLGKAFIHIRVVFFNYFNIGMFFVKIFYKFFNGLAAEAFRRYMPIFNLYFFAAGTVGRFVIAAAAGKECGTHGCQQNTGNFFL